MCQRRSNPTDFHRSYGQKIPIKVKSDINFVIIFPRDKLNAKMEKIKEVYGKEEQKYLPIGSCPKDYQFIQNTIIQNARQNKIKISQLSIFLITDLQIFKKIYKFKVKDKTFHRIRQVFLCYDKLKQKQQAQQIMNECDKINKNHSSFDVIMTKIVKKFQQSRQEYNQILKNFIYLGQKDHERSSYILKVRFVGCLNIKQDEIDQYRQKFYSLFSSQFGGSSIEKDTKDAFDKAIEQYKNKNIEQFSSSMLKLYQKQSNFYKFVNKTMLKFHQQSLQWLNVSLPVALLFKAIRHKFKQHIYDPQYLKMFGQKDYCYLYRFCKKSNQQIELMKQKQETNQNLYFQFKNFLSTSKSFNEALSFLNRDLWQTNCMIKIKLRKPLLKKQIQCFSFIYQTFVQLQQLKVGNAIEKDEVLLNALTVGKFIQITYISYKDIQNKSKALREKFKDVPQSYQIPVIEMEVGFFQDELEIYKQGVSKMVPKNVQVIENYLIVLDLIKKEPVYDIGCALRTAGNLQEAYQYEKKKIGQLRRSKNCQQEKSKQIKEIDAEKELENAMQMHARLNRLSDICSDLNLEQEAIQSNKDSIQYYKLIQKIDISRTQREHEQYLNKMYEKTSVTYNQFNRPDEAVTFLQSVIEDLKKQAIQYPEKKQLCQYLIAQRELTLGTLHFRLGNFTQAKQTVQQSNGRLEIMYKQIGYDNLKKQTFFFGFILFLLKSLFTGEKADMQQFFQDRRAQNIEQATFIYGGRTKFQTARDSSKELMTKMQQFIDNNQANLKKDKNGNLVFCQGQDPNELDPQKGIPINTKMQMQFGNDKLLNDAKPKYDDFFTQLRDNIQRDEKSTKTRISKQFRDIMKLVIQRDKFVNKDEKMQNMGKTIVQQMLKGWDQLYPHIQYEESAIQKKTQIEKIVVEAIQQIICIQTHQNRSDKAVQIQQSKEIAQEIQQSLEDHLKRKFQHPTYIIQKYYKIIIKCFENCEDYKNQISVLDRMLKMLKQKYDRQDLIQKKLDAYLKLVKIHDKIADYDFLNLLQNVDIFKRRDVRQIQQGQQAQIANYIKKAFQQINKFQELIKVRKYVERNNYTSKIKQRQNQVNLQSKQTLFDKKLQNHEQNVKSLYIQFKLWKIKLNLLNVEAEKTRLGNIQINIQRDFIEIVRQINKLGQYKKEVCLSFYSEISGYYTFLMKFKSKKVQYSIQNIRKSVQLFRKGINTADNINDINRKLQIVTKVFFIFLKDHSSQIKNLEVYLSNHIINRSQSSFWKICLIFSFIKEDQYEKDYFVNECLKFLSIVKQKSAHFEKKYQIIKDWWSIREKQRRFTTRKHSIHSRILKREQIVRISQRKSQLIRKQSSKVKIESIYIQTDQKKNQAQQKQQTAPIKISQNSNKLTNNSSNNPLSKRDSQRIQSNNSSVLPNSMAISMRINKIESHSTAKYVSASQMLNSRQSLQTKKQNNKQQQAIQPVLDEHQNSRDVCKAHHQPKNKQKIINLDEFQQEKQRISKQINQFSDKFNPQLRKQSSQHSFKSRTNKSKSKISFADYGQSEIYQENKDDLKANVRLFDLKLPKNQLNHAKQYYKMQQIIRKNGTIGSQRHKRPSVQKRSG